MSTRGTCATPVVCGSSANEPRPKHRWDLTAPESSPPWLLAAVTLLAVASAAFGCSRTRHTNGENARRQATAPAIAPKLPLSLQVTDRMSIDQFGYPLAAQKIAVVTLPQREPGAANAAVDPPLLEVRRVIDDAVVFSAKAELWCRGATDAMSGERGYWFDFSTVNTQGNYVIVHPGANVRSFEFNVAPDPYRDLLKAALRAFYFNRSNIAKQRPHACVDDRCWLIGQNYLGPGQDREARSVLSRGDRSTARDLSGGWWDAGDVNKYVTFARSAVHQLLTAFSQRPEAFGDDFNLPESGNGIPDVIDEVMVELDWLKRMQPDDLGGGVLIKMGLAEYGDPVPDRSRLGRYYYPSACSSASIVAAGMFAHAAIVLKSFPTLDAYANELRRRAELAYRWQASNVHNANCDTGELTGGDADRTIAEQRQDAVVAAIYLDALTGSPQYAALVESDYALTRPFHEDRWSVYDPDQGDALLFYAIQPHAIPAVRAAILERKRTQLQSAEFYNFAACSDLFRAHMRRDSYHWGSNAARANYANTIYDAVDYGLVGRERQEQLRERALGLLQHFHGVNPLQLVYLSNMGQYGAEQSVSEIFHAWFRDGDDLWDSASRSRFGPAPGYVVGGPNEHYCEAAAARCASSSLRKQPPGKAYRDFNTGWAPELEFDRSWELSEPSIAYQSAYVKLVSKFVGPHRND